MPRDGLNQYSPPPGTNGITNYTIESTKYNSYVADVTQDLNLPRPIVAGGTGASSATQALFNLSGETATQVVTNWDSQLWLPGSFYAATTATGAAPVAGHAFAGVCYLNEPLANPPTNKNLVVEATDLTDPVNPIKYQRIMTAGVWGPWTRTGNTGTSGSQIGEYLFDTGITFPPAAGTVRFNNATQNAATELFISHLTASGIDVTTSLPFVLKNGYDFLIQDKADPTKYKTFTMSASPVLSGGDFRVLARLKTAGVDLTALRVLLSANNDVGSRNKNYIINGAMQISQENGSAASTANLYYPVDQFVIGYGNTGTPTIQQVASLTPSGSPNRIRLTVTVADPTVGSSEYCYIQHAIEGYRISALRFGSSSAKTLTLQFGVRAPAGTYGVSFINIGATRGYVTEYTITAAEANTDVVKSVILVGDTTGTWPVDNSGVLSVRWGLMAGATFQGTLNTWAGSANVLGTANQYNFMGAGGNVFELFDVGLYEGSSAPCFVVPDYISELASCQRYFRFVGGWWQGQLEATNGIMMSYVNSPPLRATPTVTGLQNTIGIRRYANSTSIALAVTAHVDMFCTQYGGRYYFQFAGALSVGERVHIETDNILKLNARM